MYIPSGFILILKEIHHFSIVAFKCLYLLERNIVRLSWEKRTIYPWQIIQSILVTIFYAPCPYKALVIMVIHRFLFFVPRLFMFCHKPVRVRVILCFARSSCFRYIFLASNSWGSLSLEIFEWKCLLIFLKDFLLATCVLSRLSSVEPDFFHLASYSPVWKLFFTSFIFVSIKNFVFLTNWFTFWKRNLSLFQWIF